jgi:UDP-GlcNAc:undecaprenyl-phosphate/decaprenyl-phosphate GlcNAc-1-phosphate transferase
MAEIMQFVPILVVGFAASLSLTPVSRQIAMRLGVVDKPNHRKIHLDNKPLMGGLAIYVALALALLLFSPPRYLAELAAVLAGAAFLALIGLLDDRYELSARTKFAAQAIAALGLIAVGIKVNLFDVPVLDTLVTIIWVCAITNATNFMDNMDGLTAGMSTIAAGFFMLIALTQGLTLVSSLAAALLGSALGFLVYNFRPASIFMGDMGSMVLGFTLSVLAIKLRFEQQISIYWIVPALVLALPIFDICLVTFTRILEGRSPLQAGKDHTSHRLMSVGLTHRKTLLTLYTICVIFGTIGLVASVSPIETAIRLGIFALLLAGTFLAFIVWARERFQKSTASTTQLPGEKLA